MRSLFLTAVKLETRIRSKPVFSSRGYPTMVPDATAPTLNPSVRTLRQTAAAVQAATRNTRNSPFERRHRPNCRPMLRWGWCSFTRGDFFFFFIQSIMFARFSFSFSVTRHNSDPRSQSRLFSPLLPTAVYTCLNYYREKNQRSLPSSTRVE